MIGKREKEERLSLILEEEGRKKNDIALLA